MTPESISIKKQEASDRFDELQKQRSQIEEELLRLQGEYRALDTLVKDEPQDPSTIDVEPSLAKSEKVGKK